MGSDVSSVWNFCARYSDVDWRGLKWRPRKTSAVFSWLFLGKSFVFGLVFTITLAPQFRDTRLKEN